MVDNVLPDDNVEEIAAEAEDQGNQRNNLVIAMLVAMLAAMLAVIETSAKSSETAVFTKSIEVNDLWLFYQAKSIRATFLGAEADMLELTLPAHEKARQKVEEWRRTVSRLNSEPDQQEGRKELLVRAQKAEHDRNILINTLSRFEYGSAALQIGIVTASSSLVLGIPFLAIIGGVVGVGGFFYGVSTWIFPPG